MALQAMAHRLLDHHEPASYAEFLRQRLEINYFAAACLMPLKQSVDFLTAAKADRNLAVEDFRDAFGVTHEAAALRFTNLGTAHLGMTVHFLRVGEDGALSQGLRERRSAAADRCHRLDRGPARVPALGRPRARSRAPTARPSSTSTPTRPTGTYWCSTQIGTASAEEFSITFGVPFADAKWFRGRETTNRATSTLPGRQLLPPPGRRAVRALVAQGVAERQAARAHPVAAAVRNLPRGRRHRAVRVPGRPLADLRAASSDHARGRRLNRGSAAEVARRRPPAARSSGSGRPSPARGNPQGPTSAAGIDIARCPRRPVRR